MRQALASELAQKRQALAREEAVVTLAKENTPEIRELRRRCLQDKLSHDRALQLLEQELQEEEATQRHQDELERMEAARRREVMGDVEQQSRRRGMGRNLHFDLLSQMERSKAERQVQMERERREDRTQADNAAAQVCNEDRQRLGALRQSQREVSTLLGQLLECQRHQRAEATAREADEHSHIHNYNTAQSELRERLADERRCADGIRNQRLQKLQLALAEGARETFALEEVRLALQQETLEAQYRHQEELALRRRQAEREEAAKEIEDTLRMLQRRKGEAMEHKEREKRELLERYTDQRRLEQLSDQQRRLRLQQYRREVDLIQEDLRKRREEEWQQEFEEAQARRLEEEKAAGIIAEERRRLLQAHCLMEPTQVLCRLLGSSVEPMVERTAHNALRRFPLQVEG